MTHTCKLLLLSLQASAQAAKGTGQGHYSRAKPSASAALNVVRAAAAKILRGDADAAVAPVTDAPPKQHSSQHQQQLQQRQRQQQAQQQQPSYGAFVYDRSSSSSGVGDMPPELQPDFEAAQAVAALRAHGSRQQQQQGRHRHSLHTVSSSSNDSSSSSSVHYHYQQQQAQRQRSLETRLREQQQHDPEAAFLPGFAGQYSEPSRGGRRPVSPALVNRQRYRKNSFDETDDEPAVMLHGGGHEVHKVCGCIASCVTCTNDFKSFVTHTDSVIYY
jgi:hypothetical protein